MPTNPESFALESQLVRKLTNTVELRAGTRRKVVVNFDLTSVLQRNVDTDDGTALETITREYASFSDKSALFRVQHDILDEDVSDNPYLDPAISNLHNAVLLTKNQTIIKAINELYTSQTQAYQTSLNFMKKLSKTIGDTILDKNLRTKYNRMQADNMIDALTKLYDSYASLSDFIGDKSEDLAAYNELGYSSMVSALAELGTSVKSVSQYWDQLTDEQLAAIFSPANADSAYQQEILIQQMAQFQESINNQLAEFKSETDEKINQVNRNITQMLANWGAMSADEIASIIEDLGSPELPEDTVVAVLHEMAIQLKDLSDDVSQLKNDVLELQNGFASLDNRVSNAEMILDNCLKIQDICSEADIYAIFGKTPPEEEEP